MTSSSMGAASVSWGGTAAGRPASIGGAGRGGPFAPTPGPFTRVGSPLSRAYYHGTPMASSKVARTGISVPENLLEKLDRFVDSTNFSSRSEVIRHAVRELLDEHESLLMEKGERFGAVMALFDLHERGASDLLHRVQHEYSDVVTSVMHMHLVDPQNCLELLMVRGKMVRVNDLINHMMGSRGVREIKSIML